jgi:hypothetical protein
MNFLDRRVGAAAVLVVAAGGIAVLARRDRAPSPQAHRAPPAATVAADALRQTRSSSSVTQPTPEPRLPAPVAPSGGPDRIEIEGSERTSIESSELAARPTTMVASDRRAWLLSEIIPDTYMHSNGAVHALTIDGGDYILRGDGRRGDDVLLVRRNSGELYLGWLDDNANDRTPLADAERPVERIEHVTRLTVVKPAPDAVQPPAQLAVTVDGKPRQALSASNFGAVAKIIIKGQQEGDARAIDVAHAFGGTLQIVELVASGVRVATEPPAAGARAVIYMNRRGRFKFAWIDPSGEPIRNTKLRDVSELALRSSKLATRP